MLGCLFVQDRSHFYPWKKCGISNPLARRIEAEIDPMRHTEVIGSSAMPLIVELQQGNGMQRLLTHTDEIATHTC